MRDLKVNEIECRVAQITDKWLTLLLYKTARTDAQILDETYGEMNWQCDYKEVKGNMYCGISVYDKEKKEWITKWDCGVESYTEKEKGEASDSFKRAGFKWGIGIELYTAPVIFIPYLDNNDGKENYLIKNNNGKISTNTKFKVEAIEIKDKEIIRLSIRNYKGRRVFIYHK